MHLPLHKGGFGGRELKEGWGGSALYTLLSKQEEPEMGGATPPTNTRENCIYNYNVMDICNTSRRIIVMKG